MFKKLSNLLFEEEVVEEDEDDFEEEYVKPAAKKAPKKAFIKETVEEEPQAAQPPVQSYFARQEREYPKINEPVSEAPKQVFTAPDPKPVAEKKPLGIQVDEVQTYKRNDPKPSPVKETPIRQKKNVTVEKSSGYEMRPVISPIFGISEKDTEGIINSINKKKTVTSKPLTGIISPMYGMSVETEVEDKEEIPEVKPVEKPKEVIKEEKIESVENLPTFSLDEILASREYDNKETKTFSLFDDEPEGPKKEEAKDITESLKTKNFSLFDDDEY